MNEIKGGCGEILDRLITEKLKPTDFERAFKPEREDIKAIASLNSPKRMDATNVGRDSMSVFDVTADDWEKEILQSDTLVLVDFWHERCPWCKRLDPIYSEVAEEYKEKVRFAKINVLESHENQHIAVEYGVMGTPTLIFFCGGRPIEAAVGFQPKEQLKHLVDDMIEKHRDCIRQSTKLETD